MRYLRANGTRVIAVAGAVRQAIQVKQAGLGIILDATEPRTMVSKSITGKPADRPLKTARVPGARGQVPAADGDPGNHLRAGDDGGQLGGA